MDKVIEKTFKLLIKSKLLIALFTVAATIILSIPLGGLAVNNSIDLWFVDDDPALLSYREFNEEFEESDLINVMISHKEGIEEEEHKEYITRLSMEFQSNENVRAVMTPFTFRKDMGLISEDGKSAMIIIAMANGDNPDKARAEFLSELEERLNKAESESGYRFYKAGLGVIYDALNKISLNDSSLFISISYILIFLLLAFFLRERRLIAAGLISLLLSVCVSMGIFAFFGGTINMVSMVLPTLIMIFGVSDSIHLSFAFIRVRAHEPALYREEVLQRAFMQSAVPCLLTSLTSAAGFASLAFSKMSVLRELGIFAAVGIMLTYIFTMLVSIIIIGSGKKELKRAAVNEGQTVLVSRLFPVLRRFKLFIAIPAVLIMVVSVFGISKLEVDTLSIGFLKKDHPVRIDSRVIEREMGSYTPVELVFESEKNAFLQRDKILAAEQFVESALSNERLSSPASILPVLSLLSRTFISTVFLSNYVDERVLTSFVNDDYSKLRVQLKTPMSSSQDFQKTLNELQGMSSILEKDGINVKVSGYLPLYVKMIEHISDTQIQSFIAAFIIIFLIVALYAASVRLSLLALVANIIPIAAVLGAMGLLNIKLDIATVTISAIALGVVVDDTMHFIHKYKHALKEGMSGERAIIFTYNESGKAILSGSIVLVLGFIILAFANVNSVMYFGILSAAVIILALVADLLLLPALLLLFPERRKNGKQ